MKQLRKTLLASAGAILFLVLLLEFIGRPQQEYHTGFYAWQRYDKAHELKFGDKGEPWTVELKFGQLAGENFGTLSIYQDEGTSPSAHRAFYLWDPTELAEVEDPEEPAAGPAEQIRISDNEDTLFHSYLFLRNLDEDPDQEIVFLHRGAHSPQPGTFHPRPGAYRIDFRDGRFEIRKLGFPRNLLFDGHRRRFFELIGFSFAALLGLIALMTGKGSPANGQPRSPAIDSENQS